MTLTYPARRNILVIQLGDIGDVVLSTTTFRAVKESYPAAQLSALLRKGYGSLLAADPHLFEIVEVTKSGGKISEIGRENLRLVKRLRSAGYDLVIDLRTGDRGAILSFLTGAPDRVGRYEAGKPFWRDRIFTRLLCNPEPALPPVHPGADQSLRLVREIGIDTADTRPRLFVSEEARENVRRLLDRSKADGRDRLVTVNPFSRWKYKEWDGGKWSRIVDWLWGAHGLPAIVVGAREERTAAEEIVRRCRGPARNLAGETTLGELAALLEISRLHLGVDSAAPHIAAAVGTPTVTIFGPSDWRAWIVQDALHRVVTPDLPCAPCHNKGCDGTERSICLEEMGEGKVRKTIGEVLAAMR